MCPLLLRTLAAVALGPILLAQAPGLRVFQPIGSQQTQLVDDQGNVVHAWPGAGNLSAHIAPDGSLLRAVQTGAITVSGATGRIQRLRFDGTVLWDHVVGGPFQYIHHDIEPMPNGNVLVIAWDRYAVVDALASGRDPATITGTVVAGGVALPLNVDFLTNAMATQFNSGAFVGTIGALDSNGGGASSTAAGPGHIPPALIGTHLWFADLVFGPSLLALRASNPVEVVITP